MRKPKPTMDQLRKLSESDIEGPIEMSPGAKILDPNKMVSVSLKNIDLLKDSPIERKRTVGMPLYDRLVFVYNYLNL